MLAEKLHLFAERLSRLPGSKTASFQDIFHHRDQRFRFLGLEDKPLRAETQCKRFIFLRVVGGREKHKGNLLDGIV